MKLYNLNKSLCFLVLFTLLLNPRNPLLSQGCSDAGICTAGGMNSTHGKIDKGSVTLNLQVGVGEQNVKIFTPQLEGMLRLSKKSTVQLKLPYFSANGNLGANSGLGDVTGVYTYRFRDTNKWQMALNIGARIGVNNSNQSRTINVENGINALPMPYQSSLGTHDLLIGADMLYKEKWLFAFGVQVPLFQFNKNGFDTALISMGATKTYQYFSSYHLIRRPDLVLKADKIFKYKKHITATAGVLAIYHLLHDRLVDRNGVERAIHGSQGLTINIPISLTYTFNDNWSITVRFASPILVREVRPDGLTRKFVAGFELRYNF
ncbi:MAG: hypothetical protein PSX81_10590 [bacterium]|nr:hypothetical protein [bacterium]